MDGHKRTREDFIGEIADLKRQIAALRRSHLVQRLAEKSLRQSEAKYRMIFEHSPLGILHFDDQGAITACNENFVTIIGSSKERLVGLNMLTDLKDEPMKAAVRKALAGGIGRYEGTYASVTARKTTTGKCIFSPITAEDGSIVGGIGIVEDISDRKKAEDALAERERTYREVVEKARDIIYVTDTQGRFTLVNPMALQVTGFSLDEIMGTQYSHLIVPEERRNVERFYGRQLRDKIPETYHEVPLRTKQGGIAWLGQYAQLVFNGEEVAGFQAIARDITDRKKSEEALRQSEEKYRSIIEEIEEGYYEGDLDGNILFFNEALCNILGYTREELAGMNSRQFMDEPTAKSIYEGFYIMYASGEPSGMFSWELTAKDGSRKTIEASASVVRDMRGKPLGFRGICRDVTERKRAESLALRSERLNAVGELATGVAHNFNNLLQIITGLGDLISLSIARGDHAAAREHVRHISNTCRMGAETVKRLQNFARIRSAAAPSEPTAFDLSETIRQAVEVTEIWWKTVPEKQGIAIALVADLAPDCWVMGRENELFEVAVNLIKNAVEALPEGGRIRITSLLEDGKVVFRMSDSGVGISLENVGKVFEPFFTTKGFQSSGMGLASAYGIVAQHGGDICVEAGSRRGTTFVVRLPPVSPPPAVPASVDEPITDLRARILVVDDIEDVATMLSEGLTEFGQCVTPALSGRDALRILSENPIDVVLCDLGMPGMNGWDVAAAVKDFFIERQLRKPPFILLTGWGGQQAEAETISRSGVDAVVEKPVDLADLMGIVRNLLKEPPNERYPVKVTGNCARTIEG